nr:SDR family NAD(P)-dependent oxidoreductase [Thalassotalea sp. G20_0]
MPGNWLWSFSKEAIVNIGSISGVLFTPFSGSYCAFKAAFNALSDVLRMELKQFGVRVVTVQPGAVQSQLVRE